MSGCDIRLVFTFPPKDSTLQYKKCVHLYNIFPYISTLTFYVIFSLGCYMQYIINWTLQTCNLSLICVSLILVKLVKFSLLLSCLHNISYSISFQSFLFTPESFLLTPESFLLTPESFLLTPESFLLTPLCFGP